MNTGTKGIEEMDTNKETTFDLLKRMTFEQLYKEWHEYPKNPPRSVLRSILDHVKDVLAVLFGVLSHVRNTKVAFSKFDIIIYYISKIKLLFSINTAQNWYRSQTQLQYQIKRMHRISL